MKTMRRISFGSIAAVIAICVTASFPTYADKANRPFKASFQTTVIGLFEFTGEGKASHMGKIRVNGFRVWQTLPTLSDPCAELEFLQVTLIAANGDELLLNATSNSVCFDLTNLPYVLFEGIATFAATGGTGRFSAATGTFDMVWEGQITPSGNFSNVNLEGVIGY